MQRAQQIQKESRLTADIILDGDQGSSWQGLPPNSDTTVSHWNKFRLYGTRTLLNLKPLHPFINTIRCSKTYSSAPAPLLSWAYPSNLTPPHISTYIYIYGSQTFFSILFAMMKAEGNTHADNLSMNAISWLLTLLVFGDTFAILNWNIVNNS